LWSPDGKQLIFNNRKPNGGTFILKSIDGSAAETAIEVPGIAPSTQSWSPDGRTLLFQVTGSKTDRDLWTLDLVSRKANPLIQTRFFEGGGTFSPDGQWIAWVSNESGGNDEIYVQAFPGPGGKQQVSIEGGTEPVWSRSGRELFFRNGQKMMSADITNGPVLKIGKPVELFESPAEQFRGGVRANFDVSPDGQHFLMIKSAEDNFSSVQIGFLSEWPEELKRRN
jgi:serine/threonine-protein kinase